MVSYYNPLGMYRHQQGPAGPAGAAPPHFHPPANSWYAAPHGGYNQQQYGGGVEEQSWAHAHHHHHHSVFHQGDWDFAPQGGQSPQVAGGPLPSPPITVSSSELSSPGGAPGGAVSPQQHTPRPAPVRSPYEWMKKPSYQSQPNPEDSNSLEYALNVAGKTRTKDKYRVVYSDHQRLELEKEFHYSRYITIRRKAELAATLGLSERQVKIWFQNRRAKERKQTKKREELLHREKLEVAQAQHLQHAHAQQHMAVVAAGGGGPPPPPPHPVVM